jgi:hypothetical protein
LLSFSNLSPFRNVGAPEIAEALEAAGPGEKPMSTEA